MSQIDKVIIATKQLFSQRDEQIIAFSRDETLFQAAITFNLAIKEFERREHAKSGEINKKRNEERTQLPQINLGSPETRNRARAAESIARHAKDGRKIEIPVIHKPKKKQILGQAPVELVKKPVAVNATSIKRQQNKPNKRKGAFAGAPISWLKIGKPKRGRTMCPKCGERFSPVHKCPPGPWQPTYTNVKPPAVSRKKTSRRPGAWPIRVRSTS